MGASDTQDVAPDSGEADPSAAERLADEDSRGLLGLVVFVTSVSAPYGLWLLGIVDSEPIVMLYLLAITLILADGYKETPG